MRRGRMVKTKSGKKGYIYNDDPGTETKAKVHVIDERFKETGEKLLCTPESLTLIGYKD